MVAPVKGVDEVGSHYAINDRGYIMVFADPPNSFRYEIVEQGISFGNPKDPFIIRFFHGPNHSVWITTEKNREAVSKLTQVNLKR